MTQCKDHQTRVGDKMLAFYKQLRKDRESGILDEQRYVLYLAHWKKVRDEIAKGESDVSTQQEITG